MRNDPRTANSFVCVRKVNDVTPEKTRSTGQKWEQSVCFRRWWKASKRAAHKA